MVEELLYFENRPHYRKEMVLYGAHLHVQVTGDLVVFHSLGTIQPEHLSSLRRKFHHLGIALQAPLIVVPCFIRRVKELAAQVDRLLQDEVLEWLEAASARTPGAGALVLLPTDVVASRRISSVVSPGDVQLFQPLDKKLQPRQIGVMFCSQLRVLTKFRCLGTYPPGASRDLAAYVA